jgi:mRNA-degrading endonuclease RelE of RelBE toxin-antitoxin system
MKRSLKKATCRFTPEAVRLIDHTPARNQKVVRSSIDTLLANPHTGSELTGELEGYRSLKAKRYRIIYRLNDSEPVSKYILSVIAGMFTIPFARCSSGLNNNRESG